MLRLLLVDDHALCRQSLAAHLLRCEGTGEVLEAGTAEDGLRIFSQERPDVVVLSVDLPNGRVFEAARAMRRIAHKARVLLLGARLCDTDIEEALAIPTEGIILKRDSLASLCQAIEQANRGETFFSEPIRNRLQEVNGHLVLGRSCSPMIGGLAPRERQLLAHLARGTSLKQAAAAMTISYKTADNQKSSLMRKLGIHDRVELAHFAIREGLVSLTPRPSESASTAGTSIR